MANFMLQHVTVKTNILDDQRYAYLFSVEEVNRQVLDGVPFRDAYKQVGLAIEEGNFNPDKSINHTHEGSIGNLGNHEINEAMNTLLQQFKFTKTAQAIEELVK